MKRSIIFLIIGILVISTGGVALAVSSEAGQAPPGADVRYEKMYEACHGPNGFMTRYFRDGTEGNLHNYEGMMGPQMSEMMRDMMGI